MIDLSDKPNPYNWTGPVRPGECFAGRQEELQTMRYYFEEAQKAAECVSLAILGPRAAGKTSFLNMMEHEARQREFCIARIDLDEALVTSELSFLFTLFDSIFDAACEVGAYQGKDGKTYDVYVDMVNAYEVPSDKEFCPFLFPIWYAKALSVDNLKATMPTHTLARDLKRIREEVSRPVVVLLDECDLLTTNRALLQKLRNLFQSITGYMVVLTGTENLSSLMDEVFSPMMRQFKKITIGPFRERYATWDCIIRPLESIGIEHASRLVDSDTLDDLHTLSGGRPYEIQLVCHQMFRRLQEGRAEEMQLDVEMLNEVLRELETSEDLSTRRVITRLRSYDPAQLRALSRLVPCSGRASFEQLWFAEYAFRGDERWAEDKLNEELTALVTDEILRLDGDIVQFAGDEFDRVYLKYYARSRDIEMRVDDWSFERLLLEEIEELIKHTCTDIVSLFPHTERITLDEVLEAPDEVTDSDVKKRDFYLAHFSRLTLYLQRLDFWRSTEADFVRLTVSSPWGKAALWFTDWKTHQPIGSIAEDVSQKLREATSRASTVGGEITVTATHRTLPPVERFATYFEQSAEHGPDETSLLSAVHASSMSNAYLKKEPRDLEESLFHARLAYRYNPLWTSANNLGYLHMIANNLDTAAESLQEALAQDDKPESQALPNYNLGVIYAKQGSFVEALEKLELSARQAEKAKPEQRQCSCLLVPETGEKGLQFTEVNDPDLLEVAEKAIKCIEEATGAGGSH